MCTVDGTIHPVLGALGFGRIAFLKAVLGLLAHWSLVKESSPTLILVQILSVGIAGDLILVILSRFLQLH